MGLCETDMVPALQQIEKKGDLKPVRTHYWGVTGSSVREVQQCSP